MSMIRLFAALLVAAALSACGGGGGSPGLTPGQTTTTLFTTAPETGFFMTAGQSQQFSIGGGKSPYTAVSNDISVATVAVNGNSFAVSGISAGTALITLTDSAGVTVKVPVAVNAPSARALFTSAPSSVTIAAGAAGAQSYTVGGGTPPYTATSSNASVVSASLDKGTLTLTGLSGGTANIVVMDSLGSTLTIPVTVPSTPNLTLFTTAPAGGIVVTSGSASTYSVGGGSGPYSAASSNTSVASVTLSGSTLVIAGLTVGNATVVVRDATGTTVSIPVTVPAPATVPFFTTAPSAITVAIGAAPAYTIGGGTGPYTATSSNTSVATVSASGTNLAVQGIAAGNATVLVRDAAGNSATIAVTVSAAGSVSLFTTAPPAVTIAPGSPETYTIGGGTGPYAAASSNTSVAKVSVAGTALTVTGVAPGTANVVVRDNSSSTPITIAVTVASPQLGVSPTAATALVGDTLKIAITGGTAPYTAVVTNTLVADASVTGNTLTVNVKQPATSVPIVVTDANGASTSFTLTSTAGGTQIQLSPVDLTISELSTEPFSLTVYGAVGAINAFSSDTALLSTSVSGNVVTVSTGSNNNRCVSTVPVGGSKDVKISVVDSTGATAVSTVHIQDSVASCP